jgi:hypothetical protein
LQSTLAVVLVLVAARFAWGSLMAWRLKHVMNEIAALGAPVSVEQLQQKKIPDDRNGAPLWIAAMNAVDPNHDVPAASNLEYRPYPPYPYAFTQLLESGVAANTKTLSLTR